MVDIAGTVIDGVNAVVPLAASSVRKLIDNARDRQAMTQMIENALKEAATTCPPDARPSEAKIRSVAEGAVRAARTGSAVQAPWRKRVVKHLWPKKRGSGLESVGSETATARLALWVRAGAEAAGEGVFDDPAAELTANIFVRNLVERRDSVDPVFADKLRGAWLALAEAQEPASRWLRWREYFGATGVTGVLAGAAAAAGTVYGLTGDQVLHLAVTVGITTIAGLISTAFYRADRDPDSRERTEAEFRRLLNLIRQTRLFVIDLQEVQWDQVSPTRDGQPPKLPPLLTKLVEVLDDRLLPEAESLAPNLQVRLKAVSDELHLLLDGRPAFNLQDFGRIVEALWFFLEDKGDVPASVILRPTMLLAIEGDKGAPAA